MTTPSSTVAVADAPVGMRLWWVPPAIAAIMAFLWTPWDFVWDGHFFFRESTAQWGDYFTLSYFQNPGTPSADAYFRPLDRLRLEGGFRLAGWIGVILPTALAHGLGTLGLMQWMGRGRSTLWLALIYACHPLLSEPLHYLPGQADLFLASALIWIMVFNNSGRPLTALLIAILAPWLKESAWVLPCIHLAQKPNGFRWHCAFVCGMAALWLMARPDDIGTYRHADNAGLLLEGMSTSVSMMPNALLALFGLNLEERGHFVPVVGRDWLLIWPIFVLAFLWVQGRSRLLLGVFILGTLQHVLSITEDVQGRPWMPWSSRFYVLCAPVLILWIQPYFEKSWTSLRAILCSLTVTFFVLMHASHAGYWSNDVVLWRSMTREPVGVRTNWHNRVMAEWRAGNQDEALNAAKEAGNLGLKDIAADSRFQVHR